MASTGRANPSTATRSSRLRTTCSRMARPVDWSSTTITVAVAAAAPAAASVRTCALLIVFHPCPKPPRLASRPCGVYATGPNLPLAAVFSLQAAALFLRDRRDDPQVVAQVVQVLLRRVVAIPREEPDPEDREAGHADDIRRDRPVP